jgi:hypothetical protein
MPPTICISCGRELSPQLIPGAWRCGDCTERLKAEKAAPRPAGTAPPPEPDALPEGTTAAQGPPNATLVAETVHTGEIVQAPQRATTAPPATAGRPDPTWRDLGHWLGLAEAGDETPAARQAGAAFRLYCLAEMGLPLKAAQELTIIRGKLTMSAALLRYLAEQAGYRIDRADSSDESCTAVLIHRRTGEVIGTATFTIQQAQRAGLIRGGSAWVTYPDRMLWARASAYVVRDFAPGVTLGLRLQDEMDEDYARGAEPIGIDADYGPVEKDEEIPF